MAQGTVNFLILHLHYMDERDAVHERVILLQTHNKTRTYEVFDPCRQSSSLRRISNAQGTDKKRRLAYESTPIELVYRPSRTIDKRNTITFPNVESVFAALWMESESYTLTLRNPSVSKDGEKTPCQNPNDALAVCYFVLAIALRFRCIDLPWCVHVWIECCAYTIRHRRYTRRCGPYSIHGPGIGKPRFIVGSTAC